jgi:hypothetical protein
LATTATHPDLAALPAAFYDGARKVVPALLELELDALGLAAWIMDDGARDGRQLRINAQSFDIGAVSGLCELLLAKVGVQMTTNFDRDVRGCDVVQEA